jgi:hypothetical protein
MRETIERGLKSAGIAFEEPNVDWAFLRIPAKHSSVGDLLVGETEGEVIVAFGPGHGHSHFDEFSVGEGLEGGELESAIAEGALSHILAILEDRVVIEVLEDENRVLQTNTYRLPYVRPPIRSPREGVRVERLVWSGAYRGGVDAEEV